MLRLRKARGRALAGGRLGLVLVLLAGMALQGCSSMNPINWYRDATGISKNDSPPDERNTQNLEAGGKEPYPNLASVPPPPDTAMSGTDREKLQEGLVADRAHARYSDEAVRTGQDVPPLPGDAPPEAVVQAPAPAVPPQSSGTPSAGAKAAAAPANKAPAKPPAQAAKRSLPKRGSEAPPQESSLTSPSVRSVPQGEAPQAPPPAPEGVQPRQQAAAVQPLPAPPPPVFAPHEPAPAPKPAPSAQRHGPSITMAAAEIYFADGSTALTPQAEPHLAEVARLYKQNGGTVRIVGYGQRGHGAEAAQQELSSFSAAIDRANAVAQALAKLGIPTSHIIVQAAPTGVTGGAEDDRAEVLLEY